MAGGLLIPVSTLLSVALFVWSGISLVVNRRYFRNLQAQGLPMPPHSFLFGHIPMLIKMTNSLPSDAHPLYLPTLMRREYPQMGPNFYLDLWPLAPSMLLVGSPEMTYQVSNKYALEKNFLLKNFLRPLTDGLDIVSMDGAPWKQWRAVFNPGFSAVNVTKLAPVIVREIQVYCDIVSEHVVKGDVFAMKSLTDNLILDIIGQVTLDIHLNCQKTFNQFVRSLRTQIKWMTTGVDNNLFNRYNPLRPFVQWYHGRIVNQYVSEKLNQRIHEWTARTSDSKHNRTITDLALNAYTESQSNDSRAVMDPYFQKICQSQIKIFLFAGHDTTSSGICFNLWLLSQNPTALARLQEEHTTVFGPDPSKAAEMIAESPHMVNQLQYTAAVIKESLRMFTPVTSSRAGDAKVNLIDSQGRVFPTKDLVVWTNQHSIHYDPKYWSQPESFMPERWLAAQGDALYPTKGMWRPFEQGPRGCIGQELAMLEMKIVLVLVSRTFKIKPAYAELDAKEGRKQTTVLGEKAYQVDIMQPRNDLPVRVERIR